MDVLSFCEDYCKDTLWPKVTISKKQGEWIKIFVFSAFDTDIENELDLLQKLCRKHKLTPADVPWRSPKGPNVLDPQGTFRGLLGNQQKNWWFNEKNVF